MCREPTPDFAQVGLSLAAIYDRAIRTEAAKIGSVGLQVVCDRVLKFYAHSPDGPIDCNAPDGRRGRTPSIAPRWSRSYRAGRSRRFM